MSLLKWLLLVAQPKPYFCRGLGGYTGEMPESSCSNPLDNVRAAGGGSAAQGGTIKWRNSTTICAIFAHSKPSMVRFASQLSALHTASVLPTKQLAKSREAGVSTL